MTPEPFVVEVPGAELSGELTRHEVIHPAARAGLVVVRTPYDARRHRDLAASFARRGYDCLVQDVRGRYQSSGHWRPYAGEGADGLATLAALDAAGLGGPVVLFGASYAAHTALETAVAASSEAGTGAGIDVSAVIAAVPALGLHETAYDTAGRAQFYDRIGWWHLHGFTRTEQPPLPTEVLAEAARIAEERGPLAVPEYVGWDFERRVAWARLWVAEPLNLTARYGAVGVPLLVVSGDLDPFDGHARRLALAWGSAGGPRAELLSGRWGHDLVPLSPATPKPGVRILDWLAREVAA